MIELSPDGKARVACVTRYGRTPIEMACPRCGSEDVKDGGSVVGCGSCGAKTKCYTSRLGEYQREMDAAARDWNDGKLASGEEMKR